VDSLAYRSSGLCSGFDRKEGTPGKVGNGQNGIGSRIWRGGKETTRTEGWGKEASHILEHGKCNSRKVEKGQNRGSGRLGQGFS